MARIAGVDLPPQKRIWIGLTSIYGIGQPRARALCAKANVEETKKIKDLTEEEINRLRQAIESEGRVEGDLRKEVQMNIRRLIEIQCYRGLRHRGDRRGERDGQQDRLVHQPAPPAGQAAEPAASSRRPPAAADVAPVTGVLTAHRAIMFLSVSAMSGRANGATHRFLVGLPPERPGCKHPVT